MRVGTPLLQHGNPWEKLVLRADQLAAQEAECSPLVFYARLLRLQAECYSFLDLRRPTGAFDADLNLIGKCGHSLFHHMAAAGPEPLRTRAQELLKEPLGLHSEMRAYWRTRSPELFFSKALLQPYCSWLIRAGMPGASAASTGQRELNERRCPWCRGFPQVAWLDPAGSGTESPRYLLCSTCLTAWPLCRVVCASCGSEDERKLAAFSAVEPGHVRVDACDQCRRYIKTVDLSRLGLAEPLVDEVAASALDILAREHNYRKIALNLAGL